MVSRAAAGPPLPQDHRRLCQTRSAHCGRQERTQQDPLAEYHIPVAELFYKREQQCQKELLSLENSNANYGTVSLAER